MKFSRFNSVYWMGAIMLMIAPFFIDTLAGKGAIICALSILTFQAYQAKLKTIVAANIVSIVGYAFSLLRVLL